MPNKSATQRLLRIPFWLAVLIGGLGYVVTFVPGAECAWFCAVAVLSVFGLFISRASYRVAAALMLVLAVIVAVQGHQRGVHYRQWLSEHP